MAIKKFRPTSPGRRNLVGQTFEEITRTTPEKSLVRQLNKRGGRNAYGRITVRHHGGGHARKYRVVDFKRDKLDIPARVDSIEYDPNRSARIALVVYADGEKRYILAPVGLKVGTLSSAPGLKLRPRLETRCHLSAFLMGTLVHNVELNSPVGVDRWFAPPVLWPS